jgi:uncharacterized repeat protein (TIGR01451 family)
MSFAGLGFGGHTFRVTATDPAGNDDPTPAERSWTIDAPPDTNAPDTTIDSGPAASTTETSATFGFSANEGGSRFECALDGAPWATCASPLVLTTLPVGTHALAVRAIDAAGNTDPTPAAREWTVEAAVAPPPPPPGNGGVTGPDLALEAVAEPNAPAVGSTVTYVLTIRNLAANAEHAFVSVQLPAQVAYVSSTTSRGPGCTGAATLSCDLATLAGAAVATVRIAVAVHEAGTLVLQAVSSSQPTDMQSANDTATVTTIVPPREAFIPPKALLPVLRSLAPSPHVTRHLAVASLVARFSISEAARLRATVTPLRSRRPLVLLARTSLAGSRISGSRTAASATVKHGGAYVFKARVAAAGLTKGRTYVVRITASDAAGAVKTLSIRVRA